MYINSISNANSLPVTNPQFKKGGKFLQAVKNTVSPVSKPTANVLRALFLSGVMMFGATSCGNNPPTQEIKTEELAKYPEINPTIIQSIIPLAESRLEKYYGFNYTYEGIVYNDNNFKIIFKDNNGKSKNFKYDPKKYGGFRSDCGYSIKPYNEVNGDYTLHCNHLDFKYTKDGNFQYVSGISSPKDESFVALYAKNSGITISPSQSVERKIEEVSTKKAEMKYSANEKRKRKRLNEAQNILIGFGIAFGLFIVAFGLARWVVKPCDLDSPFEVSPPVRKRKKEWEPFYTKWLYDASDWFDSKFPDDTHYMDGL